MSSPVGRVLWGTLLAVGAWAGGGQYVSLFSLLWQNSDKKQLKGQRVCFGLQFSETQSILVESMVGCAWAAGHIAVCSGEAHTHAEREWGGGEMLMLSTVSLFYRQPKIPAHGKVFQFRSYFPSFNLTQSRNSPRLAQRFISVVTWSLIKVTIKNNHHMVRINLELNLDPSHWKPNRWMILETLKHLILRKFKKDFLILLKGFSRNRIS